MKQINYLFLLLALGLSSTLLTSQEATTTQVTLAPSADNTIYSENDNSNGAGEHIFAGSTANDIRRGLIKFDLADLPSGTVTDVQLILTGTNGGENTVTIHKATSDWGEGTSDSGTPGGQGAAPTANDATWNFSFFDTIAWTTPGGDFVNNASATGAISSGSTTTFSSDALIADVQEMLNNPEANFGWFMLGEEGVARSAVRIAGRSAAENAAQLVVTIEETPDCGISGGTIAGTDGTTEYNICAGDGVSDALEVTLQGNEGPNSLFVVTDADLNIIDLQVDNTFDFEGAGPGVCLIWNLTFDDNIEGAGIGENAANLSGCFELSNAITVTRNGVDGGRIAHSNGSTEITICAGDGISDAFDVTLEDNVGSNQQWVITDDALNILGLPSSPVFDLEGAGDGICLIWSLSYEDGLTGAEVGLNAADLSGCFSLSNAITVNRNGVDGGTLAGGPFDFVVGDDVSDFIEEDEISLEGNTGDNSQWIVTDEDGNILVVPDAFSSVDFNGAEAGICFLWHLSSTGEVVGLTPNRNTADIQGCFSLSNPLTIIRSSPDCAVSGGALDGGPFEFTVGDGIADMIADEEISLEESVGENSQWVVTDEDGTILGLPGSFTAVNFDGAGEGTCFLWHLSFDDEIDGLLVESNISEFEGCYSLSNPVTIIRNSCDVDGGVLTGGPFTFTVGDGEADMIGEDEITLEGNTGEGSQWVVTDEDGTILGLPGTFAAVNFDGAGEGTCFVWHLSFTGDVAGLVADANTSDLEGCFNLSNPVTVQRIVEMDSCDVDGGTLTGGPFTFTVGDGEADMIGEDEITLDGNAGEGSQWVVTDEDGTILGLPGTFAAVNFDGAGEGTCFVWHLSFTGDVAGLVADANASDLEGCFNLSNPITVQRIVEMDSCDVDGGVLTGGPFTFTVGDGEADMIGEDEITLEGNTGEGSQWVVTDEDGTILGLPGTFAAVNFDGAGEGTCFVWHLSFTGEVGGLVADANASDLEGCFNLSNPITVQRIVEMDSCDVDGGTLTGGPFTFTVGDGEADMIGEDEITLEGNIGEGSQWVVTDEDGTILGLPGTFAAVNFDGAGEGSCFVWHLSFTGDVGGLVADANASDLEGCFNLSNPITVQRIVEMDSCNVDGGTLTGGPFTFTVGDGEADMIGEDEITLEGNIGEGSQWVVTDEDGTILGLPGTFAAVNFDGAGEGTCFVWHLSFTGDVAGLVADANTSDLEGCFNLSNPITVQRIVEMDSCDVDGGVLTGGPFTFTVGDGEADMIGEDEITLDGNAGEGSQWVVTDEDGTILGLPGTFAAVNFDGAGEGTCFVWHLSFTGEVAGLVADANASDLEGCFNLSNPVTVQRIVEMDSCDVDGGTLTGGPFTFTVGDGEADMIGEDEITLEGNTGEGSQWVVTDEDGTILGLPGTFAAVNFDGAGEGTCFVWHLSFTGDVAGLVADANTSDLEGCFDLSNPITVQRIVEMDSCDVDGGTLTGGPFTFTVGDGEADMIGEDEITLEGNTGEGSQWVVTDEDGTILGLPGTFAAVNFDGAGEGTCFVWHLSFTGEVGGLIADANASDLEGCFNLSNPITVQRIVEMDSCDVDGGTLTGGPYTFTVGDGEADMIGEDEITLEGNTGEGSQWVVTDEDGTILGLPGTFAAVNFDGAGEGTCFVWHLSFTGEVGGLIADANASDLEGCFNLSNPITVQRIVEMDSCDVDGGTLTGGPFTFTVGDGEADMIGEDEITLEGNTGEGSQWVVTDEDGTILGLPGTFAAVNFDGAGEGTCFVWHLSFTGEVGGLVADANASDLEGCFNLSNPITVQRIVEMDSCDVDGGTLTGGPFTFTVGDGEADMIGEDEITLEGNTGEGSQWVVTDENGTILGLPGTFAAVNFDGAGEGTCFVYHLSFTGEVAGLAADANTSDLEGCFDLSNPISVQRTVDNTGGGDCDVNGGSITTASGFTTYTICAGDGNPDPFDIRLSDESGDNSAYVITDVDANILAIVESNRIDLEGAGFGTCLVWHLSYSDDIQGADVGGNAGNLTGCFSLSNPITVERIDCSQGCQTPLNVRTSVRNNSVTVRWDPVLGDNNGYEIMIGFVGVESSFITIPVTKNSIKLSRNSDRDMEIKVRTVCEGDDRSSYTEPILISASEASSRNVESSETTQFGDFSVITSEGVVSPNPASNYISLSYVPVTSTDILNVYDGSGKKMMSTTLDINTDKHTLNISDLRAGIYMMTVQNANELTVQKRFIKMD